MSGSGKQGCKVPTETVVHHSQHDVLGDEELSTSVLMALDSLPEYDVESGDMIVFDQVDLDALDDIFRPVGGTSRAGQVTFVTGNYEVTATSDGEITICERSGNGD